MRIVGSYSSGAVNTAVNFVCLFVCLFVFSFLEYSSMMGYDYSHFSVIQYYQYS